MIQLVVSPFPAGTKAIDLTGQRFGRLTARGFYGFDDRRRTLWLCDCGCGSTVIAQSSKLRRGHKQSCGCLVKLVNGTLNLTHGQSRARTPEYRAWEGAKDRCTNSKGRGYARYGARGIYVCDRWLNGDGSNGPFECFFSDMGKRPSPRHSLDRIEVNGPYSPDNCRWALPKVQSRNRRISVLVEIDGKPTPLAELCESAGIPYGVAYNRWKAGKTIDAVLAPVMRAA